MNDEADYQGVDSLIVPWGKKHNIVFERDFKGYAVRTFWIQRKVQVWIDAPDEEGYIRVHVAELKPELRSKWGRKVEWRTTREELADCLEEVWSLGNRWL